jgi:hypothetical protein
VNRLFHILIQINITGLVRGLLFWQVWILHTSTTCNVSLTRPHPFWCWMLYRNEVEVFVIGPSPVSHPSWKVYCVVQPLSCAYWSVTPKFLHVITGVWIMWTIAVLYDFPWSDFQTCKISKWYMWMFWEAQQFGTNWTNWPVIKTAK